MTYIKKPIPSRIYNASKEHPYVAGAVDIIDDRLNKDQQEVNADTYRKDETYSKEQLNNLITTPEQQYVTLIAESGDTLADIFDGVTGAADTIYRVGNWDGEQYDPTVYSEYAWDGTNFIFLDKKEYTLATAEDFIEPDAQMRAKIPTVGALADVYGAYESNEEWVEVKTDEDDRILEGTKIDGTKVVGGNARIKGSLNIEGSLNTPGSKQSLTDNPEFLQLETDKFGNILSGRKKDGKAFESLGFETPMVSIGGNKIEPSSDPENRSEIEMDAYDRIISYRDKKGTLHEKAGITTSELKADSFKLPEDTKEEIKGLVDSDSSPSVLNRYRELVPVDLTESFNTQPQFGLPVFKSFTPAIDFKGHLVFEGTYTNPYDVTKPILFEEHIAVFNYSYDYRVYSYISSDLENFQKYYSDTKYKPFVNGTRFDLRGKGGNENGLILVAGTYDDENGPNRRTGLYWSLDGGRTLEPMTERIRAKLVINENEIQDGTNVVVGDTTLTAITIKEAIWNINGYDVDHPEDPEITNPDSIDRHIPHYPTIAEHQQKVREYLSDKILISSNPQDKLRTLAGCLIELGYKVLLKEDKLYVYYKDFGTIGNGEKITVDGVDKFFAGGEDIDNSDIMQYIVLQGNTGLKYNSGNDVMLEEVNQICSFNFVEGKWYCTGYATEGVTFDFTPKWLMNLNVVLDTDTDLEQATVTCQEIMKSSIYKGEDSYVEPIMSYNKYYNLMIVGFRPQTHKKQRYMYSKDKGVTWSSLQELPDNIGIYQANIGIFVVRDPFRLSEQRTLFYNNIGIGTENMLLALSYSRRHGVIFVSTSPIDNGIEHAKWSKWEPLNRFSKYLQNISYYNVGMYYTDQTCIGGFTYAPLHNGIVLNYVGRVAKDNNIDTGPDYGNPIDSWSPFVSFEEC